MDALLVDAIAALAEQMKSLPDAGMAEEQDFEVWGKEFCVRLVSVSWFLFNRDEIRLTTT